MTGDDAQTPMIVLLAALSEELAPTLVRLKLHSDGAHHVGAVKGKRVLAAQTGMGRSRAVAALHQLVEAHRPQQVLHVGFAGGLDPSLGAGELLDITCVLNAEGEALRVGAGVPAPMNGDIERQPRHTLLTLDHIADSVKRKAELLQRYGAGAVDMETFVVAAAARDLATPLRVVRAIADPADMSLPAAAVGWVKDDGRPDVSKAMSYLATHPWQAATLMKLQSHARTAADRIAQHVAELIEQA